MAKRTEKTALDALNEAQEITLLAKDAAVKQHGEQEGLILERLNADDLTIKYTVTYIETLQTELKKQIELKLIAQDEAKEWREALDKTFKKK